MIEHSVLKYNPETKKVEIDPQALTVKEWKELYAADKTGTKKFFQNAITLIYFLDYPESPYHNVLEQQKLSFIKRDQLPEDVVKKLMNESKVLDARKQYKESILPLAKLRYEMFKKQVDNFYADIMSIPTTVDKADKKYKLMSNANAIMEMEEKLKKKVENEKKSTVKERHRKRLFEDR